MTVKKITSLINKGEFLKAETFLKKYGEQVEENSERQLFKGDGKSNIIATFAILSVDVYRYKSITFDVIKHTLDDSINITYREEKVE